MSRPATCSPRSRPTRRRWRSRRSTRACSPRSSSPKAPSMSRSIRRSRSLPPNGEDVEGAGRRRRRRAAAAVGCGRSPPTAAGVAVTICRRSGRRAAIYRRHRDDHRARGAARRDGRGDAARRHCVPDGRGGRRIPGRLQGQPGTACRNSARAGSSIRRSPSRASPGSASAPLCGIAPDRRVHDLQLRDAGDGPDRQFGGQDALHVGRADGLPDRLPRPQRHRLARRRAAFAMLRQLVRACAGPQGGRALYRRRSQGPAQIGDPRPQPGRLPRARAGLRRELSGARGSRIPRADRQGADRARGRPGHHRRLFAHGEARARSRRGTGQGRHLRRGDRSAHLAPVRRRDRRRLGQEDQPRRHRRGGLAVRRHRLGDSPR